MAKRVQVIVEDDVDGSPADETVTFGLDGVTYEIDLNKDHAAELRDGLAVWIGHAQRTGGRRAVKASTGGRSSEAGDVRAWARSKGLEVNDRGRISAEVQAAYDKAHS